MTGESLPGNELSQQNEITRYQAEVGLQGRLMLFASSIDQSKVLKINEQLNPVKEDDIGNTDTHDYTLFDKRSDEERQKQSNQTVDQWIVSTTDKLHQDFSQRKGITPEDAKVWEQTISKIFKVNNINEITQDHVTQMYDKYLGNETIKGSNIKQFVKDVLTSGVPLDKGMDSILWLSRMFGIDSSDVVTQLIDAEAKIQTNKQQFITDVNPKINSLNDHEKHVLTFLDPEQKAVVKIETKTTPHWEDLQKTGRFDNNEGNIDDKLWKNVTQIRNIVENSEVIKQGLPVYYPGSGRDLVIPLAMTNAATFVLDDIRYIKEDGQANTDHLPDKQIEVIGGKIISTATEGVLGKGGKRIVKFEWGGKTRTLIEYAEDAKTFTPPELNRGASFINLIRASEGLFDTENIVKYYQTLAVGGYVHELPIYLLSPESIGYKQIIPRPDNALDDSWALFQKIKNDPQIKPILEFDASLAIAYTIRDGRYVGNITPTTIAGFRNCLRETKKMFDLLPKDKQQLILPQLKNIITPETIPVEVVVNLIKFGLTNEAKRIEHFNKSKEAALEVFPELAATLPNSEPQIILTDKDLDFQQQEKELGEQIIISADYIDKTLEPLDIKVGPDQELYREDKEIPTGDFDITFGNPRQDRDLIVFDNEIWGFTDWYNRQLQDKADPQNNLERGIIYIGRRYKDKTGRKWVHITKVFPQFNQERSVVHKNIIPDEWTEANRISDADPGSRVIGWSHTHPAMTPAPSDKDVFILQNYGKQGALISIIDDSKGGRVGAYQYNDVTLENNGGFVVLKPKLQPEDTYDRNAYIRNRFYFTGHLMEDSADAPSIPVK